MSEYSDIEQINKLYAEQANIQKAMDILDDGGTVASVVTSPTEASTNRMVISVSVTMSDPPQSMIAGIKTGLTQRYNQINQELRDLGVTGTPSAYA